MCAANGGERGRGRAGVLMDGLDGLGREDADPKSWDVVNMKERAA